MLAFACISEYCRLLYVLDSQCISRWQKSPVPKTTVGYVTNSKGTNQQSPTTCQHTYYTVFRKKNTHSCFLLCLRENGLDSHKMFRLGLGGITYSINVNIK